VTGIRRLLRKRSRLWKRHAPGKKWQAVDGSCGRKTLPPLRRNNEHGRARKLSDRKDETLRDALSLPQPARGT